MKISVNWLKDYITIKTDPKTLANKLTMAGMEVERIEKLDGDSVFEMEITPNRADCLNHIGIAREASAIFNLPLRLPKSTKPQAFKKKCNIKIIDTKDCSRYIGTIIEGVDVKPVESSIHNRLEAIGLRCINNIVDLTNFCLMEIGQPLHAFDYDKLIGGKIIVRRAQARESIVAIDGNEYKLDSSILVIADEKRPVAIAGVMGGKDTEVTEATKNILLESAYFDPILIRRGARKLGLTSDSSYRFERGVDIQGVETGSNRAVALIVKHAGGKTVGAADVYPSKQKQSRTTIHITKDQIDSFLGASVPLAECKTILAKLGCSVSAKKKDNTLVVGIPSFRPDIKQRVDVIEELARIVGYDTVAPTIPQANMTVVQDNARRRARSVLAQALAAQGLSEVVTYSLISRASLQKTKLENAQVVTVQNPLSAEQEIMRPSVLPSILPVVASNINKGQKDIRIFELGKVYPPSGERETLAIIMTGMRGNDWRHPTQEKIDFYDIKGVVEALCKTVGVFDVQFKAYDNAYFQNDLSADVIINGKKAGALGNLTADILNSRDIKQKNIFFAQLDCEILFSQAKATERYRPIPGFPAIVRDISLAVKNEVAFQQVSDIVKKEGTELLTSVRFLEQYIGDKIPAGYRGLIFSLVYQSPERTLREEEITEIHDRICQALVKKLGAIKR